MHKIVIWVILLSVGISVDVHAGRRRHSTVCPPAFDHGPAMVSEFYCYPCDEFWLPCDTPGHPQQILWHDSAVWSPGPLVGNENPPAIEKPPEASFRDTVEPLTVEESYEVKVPYQEEVIIDGERKVITRSRSEQRTRTLTLSTANQQIRYLNGKLIELRKLKADLSKVQQLEEGDVRQLIKDVETLKNKLDVN